MSSARYRVRNSGQRVGSCPNHCCNSVLGARSFDHSSSAASCFRIPRGQNRLTSTRRPSADSRGASIRLVRRSSAPGDTPSAPTLCKKHGRERCRLQASGASRLTSAVCLRVVLIVDCRSFERFRTMSPHLHECSTQAAHVRTLAQQHDQGSRGQKFGHLNVGDPQQVLEALPCSGLA
jgi:hypothetical protein